MKFFQLSKKCKKATHLHVKTLAPMKLKQFFKFQIRKLRGEPELSDELVIKMMHRLVSAGEDELTCDEVFAMVDEYAEASQRGEDVASLKPLIRQHLDLCHECDEEYEALLRVLEGTNSSNPT
jgi:hypothetical protein